VWNIYKTIVAPVEEPQISVAPALVPAE
ncbi:MAG: hypothetical protein RJB09_785, partial [Pseudomonadota bacterium]